MGGQAVMFSSAIAGFPGDYRDFGIFFLPHRAREEIPRYLE
jgi:hypothetical protein